MSESQCVGLPQGLVSKRQGEVIDHAAETNPQMGGYASMDIVRRNEIGMANNDMAIDRDLIQ